MALVPLFQQPNFKTCYIFRQNLYYFFSTTLPSNTSTEEITASRVFKKISPVPEIPKEYTIEKIANLHSMTEELSHKTPRSQ
jgi:hypothetical protein